MKKVGQVLNLITLVVFSLFAVALFHMMRYDFDAWVFLAACVGIILAVVLMKNPWGWVVAIFGFCSTVYGCDNIINPPGFLGVYDLLRGSIYWIFWPASFIGTLILGIKAGLEAFKGQDKSASCAAAQPAQP